MIVSSNITNNYVRLITSSTEDRTFLTECFSDWRTKTVTAEEIDKLIAISNRLEESSFLNSPSPNFEGALLVYCLSNNTPVGVMRIRMEAPTRTTWLGVDFAIIHPNYRGQGYFSSFALMMFWLFNKHLKIDLGQFDRLDDVPEVASVINNYKPKTLYTRPSTSGVANRVGVLLDRPSIRNRLDQLSLPFSSPIPEVPEWQRKVILGEAEIKTFELAWSIG